MKKRSIAAKLGVAALALTLVTTSLSSGTFAKYTTTVQGQASVTIAKWNVGAKLTDAAGNAEVTMTAAMPSDQLALSSTATGVQSGRVSANRLAPGMDGKFGVQIDPIASGTTATDVAIEYDIFIKKETSPAPTILPTNFKMWKAGGNKETDAITLGSEAETGDGVWVAGGTLKPGKSDSYIQYINWEWPYSTSSTADVLDTSEGTAQGGKPSLFTIIVKLTQGNPKATPDPSSHPVVNP